jgi:integrase
MAKIVFTAGRVKGFKCPPDRPQAFLWDTTAPGLGLRATPAGKPAYIFQGRFQDKTFRLTIGSPEVWTIPLAQEKARELQRQIDEGRDPRQARAETTAADVSKRKTEKAATVNVSEVWAVYVAERKPHWGERHYQDHINLSKAGGKPAKRGTDGRGVTIDMPLFPLMALPLRDLTASVIEAWAVKEAKTRPTSARLAWRLLKGFLNWCNEQPAYAGLLTGNPAKTKKSREALGKPGVKSDVLQKGQLSAWFTAMQQLQNPVIAAYLQIVLLTGARPGEVITLRWDDVNTQWRGITIRDKVEGERVIPLTPYAWHLLATLPRRNKWIFSSPTSKAGHLTEPTHPHTVACKAAGLDGLTLHGLRRSFKSLTEWLEIPAGVVAQLMGHKPSATAEKHYTVRPLDLLRVHHEKIEAWILEQAGIVFDAKAEPGKLRVVNS